MATRSLVEVRFEQVPRTYYYYNDSFDLEVGDRVFVSGRLEDKLGWVVSVSKQFKIRLSDYERVIAKPELKLRGSFKPWRYFLMAEQPENLPPEQVRAWLFPPKEEEFVAGEGFELDLESFAVEDKTILARAIDYCSDHRVAYISIQNGVGTAFVRGTQWYEVNFRLDGWKVTELFCECPYPKLCKHALAVCLELEQFCKEFDGESTVMVERSFFWELAGEDYRVSFA